MHWCKLYTGQYEYPDLNGRMRPSEAAAICDADPVCGAFTYKVRTHGDVVPVSLYLLIGLYIVLMNI
jgi:hypothetical protein